MTLDWLQSAEHEWVSADGRYRLWENAVTGNVFIYLTAGDVLLLARYNLADAQALAQEHADRHPFPVPEEMPVRVCEATLAVKDHDVLPSCMRPATHTVTIRWSGQEYEIRTCAPCAAMFTIRPTLKATVSPELE